jgi:hypothetical protein
MDEIISSLGAAVNSFLNGFDEKKARTRRAGALQETGG